MANDRSAARLSIVVPCYNEEQRLPHTIEQIERYLDGKRESYELILVDDGSTDGTRLIMDAAAERHNAVRVEALPANKGKGRALATGVATAKGSEILVTDADLSTPIEELEKLQAALRGGAGVAIASRALKGSRVEVSQPAYRVLMGKGFNLIVQAVLLPGIWDTQCGFKLFRADVAHSVFENLVAAAGLPAPVRPPDSVLYSPGVPVRSPRWASKRRPVGSSVSPAGTCQTTAPAPPR